MGAGAARRRVRATAALGIPGRRPLDLDRRRLLHEAAGRRRRGGHQGRVARGRPVPPVVGLGGGDPVRRGRRPLQLPRRLQAQRRGRRLGDRWPRRVARTAGLGRRRRLDAGLAAGGAGGAGTPRGCCAPTRTWSSRRSPRSGSTAPGATSRPPSSRCKPGPGASSGWRGEARPSARVRRGPDRGVARRPLRRHRHAGRPSTCRVRRRARRRLHARGPGDVPHLLPGDLQRPAGPTDAPEALRGDARCRRGHATGSSGSGAGPDSSGWTSACWWDTPSGWRTSRSSSIAPP